MFSPDPLRRPSRVRDQLRRRRRPVRPCSTPICQRRPTAVFRAPYHVTLSIQNPNPCASAIPLFLVNTHHSVHLELSSLLRRLILLEMSHAIRVNRGLSNCPTVLSSTTPLRCKKKDRSRKLGSSTTTSEEPKRQRTENTNTMTISRLPSDSPSIYNHIHERIRNPVRGRLMPLADQGDFLTGTAANGGTRPPNM